jgi:hypothetical protein
MKMVKKFVVLALVFLAMGAPVFSQTFGASGPEGGADASADGTELTEAEGEDEESGGKWPSWMTTSGADVSTGFKSRFRLFEIGLLNINAGFSNSWLAFGDLFELGSFDVKEAIKDGKEFDLELGMAIKPVSVRVILGSLFTLDIVTGTDASIRLDTDDATIKSLTTMQDILAEVSNLNDATQINNKLTQSINSLGGGLSFEGEAYAFVDLSGERKFLNNKLFLKAGPSVYSPIFYMPKKTMRLSAHADNYDADTGGTYKLGLENSDRMDAWYSSPFSAVGVDLSVEGRYAVWPILDAGLAISNIPLVPATMDTRYSFDPSSFSFSATIPKLADLPTTSPELKGDIDIDKMIDDLKDGTTDKITALRPVRFDFYGLYKPFKSAFLLVRPDIGFSVKYPGTDAYTTFNWGIEGQINLPIILSVSLGIKEFEEAWSNYLLLRISLGIWETSIGVGLRGPDFVSSWTGKGLNAVFGMKFGW